MTRIALVCSEPLRPRMAGIGIRFAEFARQLTAAGLEVVLASPADPAETRKLGLPSVDVRTLTGLGGLFSDCHAAVAQGYIADTLLSECPDLPTVIDLYDPWLIENIQYFPILGPDQFRADHSSWVLQLSRGDFFLCSSPEQRQFYLGFLTVLGRVHPLRVGQDPDLRRLIDEVPFGVPAEIPAHRPFLPPVADGERRLLFGALYDWYDPWPVLEALERLDRPDWRLFFIGSPNPETTPQEKLRLVKEWCRRRGAGWWGDRVQVIESLPPERRYDLLRDVDLLISTHQPGLETDLSLRTRFLDALAVGCPVATSAGGTMSRLVTEHTAGWVMPPDSASAVAATLDEILGPAGPLERRRRAANGLALAADFDWRRVVAPLVEFCRNPRSDSIMDEFAVDPTSSANRVQASPEMIARPPASTRGLLKKVTVAIASWNGREHLATCLPALAAQESPGVDWEVLVLDNGSSDGTAEWISRHHPEVRLVRSERNLGFSLANNRLVDFAEGDAVALLNNDTRPRHDWLGELVENLNSAPGDVAAAAGLIVDWSGEHLDFAQTAMRFDGHALQVGEGRGLDHVRLPDDGAELFAGCGANLLVDRRAFLEAGGFDPSYFAYFEDVDLGWRLNAGGRKIRFARDAVVHHRAHATGKRLKQAHQWFLYERNALLTVYKNYEPTLLERVMPAILLRYLWRIKALLVHGDPNAGFLADDPYGALTFGRGIAEEKVEGWLAGAGDPLVRRSLGRARELLPRLESANGERDSKIEICDDASLATLSALANFLTHLNLIAERRSKTQTARKRSDLDIFDRFPLLLVPNDDSERELFATDLFRSLFPDELPILRAAARTDVINAQENSARQERHSPVGRLTVRRTDFSVVIPTCNGKRTLPAVLKALEAQEEAPSFEVIVVDDGSSDDTARWLDPTSWDLDLTVLHQENRGPAAARNTGVFASRGRLIAFLGDDTVPEPAWLDAHREGHSRHSGSRPLAVLGLTRLHPRIRTTTFIDWIYADGLQFGYPLIEDPADVDFNFFYTSNISLPRALLIAEPFDGGFPFAAWEDIELAYRLKRHGLRIVLQEWALALHDHPTNLRRFARRQEISGHSAVYFYHRHPELAAFLGVDPEGAEPLHGRLQHWRRTLSGRLAEKLSLSRPALWQQVLNFNYRKGIERALRENKTSRQLERTSLLTEVEVQASAWPQTHPSGITSPGVDQQTGDRHAR